MFTTGHVANPKGRPSVGEAIAALVRRKAGSSGKKLVALLYDLALNDKDSNVRLKAATFLIERGYGKPPAFEAQNMQVVVLVGQGHQGVGPNPWEIVRAEAIEAGETESWVTTPAKLSRAKRQAINRGDPILPEPSE